jgi:hypothetical protein
MWADNDKCDAVGRPIVVCYPKRIPFSKHSEVLVLDWSKAAQEELVERVRVVVGMALNSDIAGTWEKGEKPYERIARASIRELSK